MREVEVAEAMADSVAGVAREQPRRDAEPADLWVVADRLWDQEHRGAGHHRAAREAVAPDHSTGTWGGTRKPRYRRRAGHRDERDPPDHEDLPEPRDHPDPGQHHERCRSDDPDPRRVVEINKITHLC